MMNRFSICFTAVLAVVAVAVSNLVAASDAQLSDDTGSGCLMYGMMGQGRMMGHGMMHQGSGMHSSNMSAAIEKRLAKLESVLQVTNAQQTEWTAYSDAVIGRGEVMQGMHQSMMALMDDGGAVERMEARIAGMEAMIEAMKAVKPATEALYAVLTDDQKKLADESIGLGCGGM